MVVKARARNRVIAALLNNEVAPNFLVKITQKVLDVSVPCQAGKCMVAQAVRWMGGDIRSIMVTCDTISFNCGDRRFTYQMPAVARLAIIDFDNRKKVEPFDFTLVRGSTRPVSIRRPTGPGQDRKHVVGQNGPKLCVRRYHGLRITQRANLVK